MVSSMDAVFRRMRNVQKPSTNSTDSRSLPGRLSRGDNVYNGGTPSSGGNQWGGSTATSTNRSDASRSRDMGNQYPSRTVGGQPLNWNNEGINLQRPQPDTQVSIPQPQPNPQPNVNPMDEFDAIYEKRLNDIMAQQAQINSRREQALRSLDQQKAFSQDALKRMFDRNLDRNEINMADRGLFRSGINIREQGDIGEDFQNQSAQALSQFASQREGLEQQFGALDTQFQDLLSQVQSERALRAEEIARERAQRDAENKALQPVLGADGRYSSPQDQTQNSPVAKRISFSDSLQQADPLEALKRRLTNTSGSY